MFKIFKYNAVLNDKKEYVATIPKTAVPIRCDFVNDGYYLGYFVWAIVNTENQELETRVIPYFSISKGKNNKYNKLIGILEDQTVFIPNKPEYVDFGPDGLARCYCDNSNIYNYTKYEHYKLIGRKTGQEIGYSPDQLTYLGMLKIWIKQELGIYMFLVKDF